MKQFQCSHALLIGINDYRNGIPRLSTAVNDATELARRSEAEHGYATQLVTQDVTAERLRRLLEEELPAQVGPQDRLLFYFAGHGMALDGDDGPQGFLEPQDARDNDPDTLLSMLDVHRRHNPYNAISLA